MEPSDAQLLVRTCRGDETAARLVWARHSGPLRAYASTILGAALRHHADDVVQSVMCAILKASPRKLARVTDARLWLATLARRHCLNTLRSVGREGRKRRGASEAAPRRAIASPREAEAPAPALAAALDLLPRRLREVVVLKHISQLTFDQIALSLDRNRSTLASQYQEAMRRLKELLQDQDRTIERDGAGFQPLDRATSPEQSAPPPPLGART